MKRFDDVKRICEYIAENHPGSDFAIKARASVAAADLLMGNDEAAQKSIDAVIKDYAKDPELAETLWKLGNVSKNQGKYNLSRQLYQHIFEINPQGPLAMQAKAAMSKRSKAIKKEPPRFKAEPQVVKVLNTEPETPRSTRMVTNTVTITKTGSSAANWRDLPR